MTSRDFAFWLQGFFEISETTQLTVKQTEIVKKHLSLVFIHEIDPSMSDDPAHQQHLNDVHNGANTQSPHFMTEGNNGENARC
jgi:hypothetical protein